jgi:hypothetical protein
MNRKRLSETSNEILVIMISFFIGVVDIDKVYKNLS